MKRIIGYFFLITGILMVITAFNAPEYLRSRVVTKAIIDFAVAYWLLKK